MELLRGPWEYIKLATVVDLIDILIVAYLLYQLIRLIKDTTAERLLKGIGLLLIVMQLSNWIQLNVLSFLFKNTLDLGFLALVILFQPELRKMLDQVGRSRFALFSEHDAGNINAEENAILQTVEACTAMSADRVGALIVFTRKDRLTDLIKTGTPINSDVSSELLKNLFYPKAPLHDGAVMMRDGRIVAAGCVLPLSHNMTLSRDLGTRHRAAVGTSEESDALCVVVSEETGSISVACGGMLKRHLAPETLEKVLRNELLTEENTAIKGVFSRLGGKGK